jgi:hypothetical protein
MMIVVKWYIIKVEILVIWVNRVKLWALQGSKQAAARGVL